MQQVIDHDKPYLSHASRAVLFVAMSTCCIFVKDESGCDKDFVASFVKPEFINVTCSGNLGGCS